MYILDSKLKKPLHIQLYEELKKDIFENYEVGQKIPSIRKICQEYSLSKNTVENAYSQLVVEGYIDSVPKSGFFIIDTSSSNFQIENSFEEKEKMEEVLYDFYPAKLSKDSFPLKLWKRLFSKTIDETLHLGAYSEGQGEWGLREQISKYLSSSRAVNCSANQIVICCGFWDSMNILARIFKSKTESFAMEHPGYYLASEVFREYGYEIEKVEVTKTGLNIDKLAKTKAKLVYVTPSHQYPTGVSMPISNRKKLLFWAKENDAYIIEDDYDSELTYENRPIPSLQGLDENSKVIYIGTFAKAFSPAIRVSYLALPKPLIKEYKKLYDANVSKVCLMTQKTLETFLKEGYWEKYLRKIRTLNKQKHNLMKELLLKKLGGCMEIVSQGGGLAIYINPTISFNFEKFEEEAKKLKIKVYFAKEKSGGQWQAIKVGFGGFTLKEIPSAVKLFVKAWEKAKVAP